MQQKMLFFAFLLQNYIHTCCCKAVEGLQRNFFSSKTRLNVARKKKKIYVSLMDAVGVE